MIHLLDLMEPEETVGNIWHDMATRRAAAESGRAVTFDAMRPSLTALFRALGGPAGVEIVASPLASSDHRPGLLRRVGTPREMVHVADFDGDRLRVVAWRTDRAVYWVTNTLLQSLTNTQMLGIAESLARVGS